MQKRQLIQATSLDEADRLLDKAESMLNEGKDPTAFQEAALTKVNEAEAWSYRIESGLLVPAARFSEKLAAPVRDLREGDFWGRR
jgi:hypothetical protein